MFNITADIFLRYRSDRLHIIGMVPQLSFPQLVSYFRKTFEQFSAGNPLQILDDCCYGQLWWSCYKAVDMVSFTTFK